MMPPRQNNHKHFILELLMESTRSPSWTDPGPYPPPLDVVHHSTTYIGPLHSRPALDFAFFAGSVSYPGCKECCVVLFASMGSQCFSRQFCQESFFKMPMHLKKYES